jgi:hypothetical protein
MRLDQIRQAYTQAAGRWRGCDWPKRLGPNKLNLAGLTATEAMLRAELATPEESEAWQAAADWLQDVERSAEQAEMEAALALAAANAGDLSTALVHARRAAEREGLVGRPHHDACWHCLEQAIEDAIKHHGTETRSDARPSPRPALERDLASLQDEVQRLSARMERLEEALASLPVA